MIPYSTQTIDLDDVKAVTEVLNSPYLTTGPTVSEFEEDMIEYVGCDYAVAVNSCTSALHLAMMALGVCSNDTVYVSAISFAASANCARFCGADVEFVDVDSRTGNIDCNYLEQMLEKAAIDGKLPKAVVCVHLSGRPCDLIKLKELKDKYHFALIEDAAHATGAEYHGSMIGSCTYSDITVFSFHPVKIITTCEGGMCLTNNEKLYKSMRALSSHGIYHDKDDLVNKNMPAFYYEMQDLGYNYRLNDVQAALGRRQLSKIHEFLASRREQAKYYEELFADDDKIGLPIADSNESVSSWHLYQIAIPDGRRDEVYTKLRNKGIGVQVHYLPIYKHPYYQKLKDYKSLAGAEAFFNATLSIPLYPKLTKLDQGMVAATIMSILDNEP